MKIKWIFPISLVALAAVLLGAACSGTAPAGAGSGGGRAWVDQPPDGSTLPLAPFVIKAHARGGVSQITFLVNGMTIGSASTDPSLELVSGEATWNPSAGGVYRLQAQASSGGGIALSEPVQVCVEGAGGAGDCQPAAPQPEKQDITATVMTPSPVSDFDFKLGASPDPVYYNPGCRAQVTLANFEAYVRDPSAAVEVTLHGFLTNVKGETAEHFQAMNAIGGGGYTAQINFGTINTAFLKGEPGTFTYTVALMNARKEFYATGPERSLQVLPCQGGAVVPPTRTPTTKPGVKPPVVTEPPPPPVVTEPPPPPVVTEPPPPPKDTTPPTISSSGASTGTAYYISGCGDNSVSVGAKANDNESGMAFLRLHWGYGKGEQTVDLNPNGGSYTINVGGEAYGTLGGANGTLSYWFEAGDNAGNTATGGGGSVSVLYCPG